MSFIKDEIKWPDSIFAGLFFLTLGFMPMDKAHAAGDHGIAQGGNNEFVMVAVPEGWINLSRNNEAHRNSAEWLPNGQGLEGWNDMITLQVFPGWAEGDVGIVLESLVDIYKKNCEVSGATPLIKDQLNGFITGFRLITCTRDLTRNTGEVSLFRALVGKQAAYLVQRVFRVPEFEAGAKPLSDQVLRDAYSSISAIGACQLNSKKYSCTDWSPILKELDGKPSVVVIKAQN